MKKSLPFLLFFLSAKLLAQGGAPETYLLFFTDKSGSSFSINQPLDFLTARSVQRRIDQNIPLVQRDLPVSQLYIDSIRSYGVNVLNRSRWLNAISVYCPDSILLNQISSLGFIQQTIALKRMKPITPITDKWEEAILKKDLVISSKSRQVTYNYGPSLRQVDMLGGVAVHAMGYKGQDMVIAVLDAGFSNADQVPELDSVFASGRILSTHDFYSGDSQVFDDHSHGTMVLSCMAANQDGVLIGTAPEASYHLLRTEDAATEYLIEEFNWVCGAEYADSVGADIINSSLGYTTFDNASMNHGYQDLNGQIAIASRAATWAAQRGMLVCNSAGNSGSSAWYFLSVPSDADSILAVGAVDSLEASSSFSSHGPSADGRIKPDCAAMGSAVIIATPWGVQAGNGTSFASPLIAGMAACLWEADSSLTAMQLRAAILEACDQYSNPDAEKGYGVPDFSQALSVVTGHRYEPLRQSKELRIYPTASRETFFVSYSSLRAQTISLQIYDSRLALIQEKLHSCLPNSENQFTIEGQALSDGVYFIRLVTRDALLQGKIIKY